MLLPGMTFRHYSPIHGFTDFREWYQSNHGMAGNLEAGGFVNSAVIILFHAGVSINFICYLFIMSLSFQNNLSFKEE